MYLSIPNVFKKKYFFREFWKKEISYTTVFQAVLTQIIGKLAYRWVKILGYCYQIYYAR